jgi:alpha-1,2-mannosyltransferase
MTLRAKSFSFLIILLAYLCFIYAHQIHMGAKNVLHTDYGKFYKATQFFQAKKNIYSTSMITLPKELKASVQKAQLAPSLNPPFFTLLTLPLAYLSYATSLWLWSLLSIACGIISVLWCQKNVGLLNDKMIGLLFIVLFFSYLPTFINNGFGQVTLLMLPLLVGAWQATRRQHLITAGILLGILISLKIIFSLFIIYFLWRRAWPTIVSLLLTTIVCGLLPLPILGWQSYIDYYQLMHHITWYAGSWNASLYGFFIRLFGGHEFNTPLIPFPMLSYFLYALASAVLFLRLIIFLEPAKNNLNQQAKCDLDFSCVIVTMLVLSPLGWLYYFPWLIIAFFTIVRLTEQHPHAFKLHIVLAIFIVLSSTPHIMMDSLLITKSNVLSVCLLSSAYVASLLLILGLLYYLRFTKIAYPTIENKVTLHYTHLFTYGLAIMQSLFSIEYLVNHHVMFGI